MNILSESMGILGVVKKIRHLFIVGQTRVHIDQVDGLGNFIELEVCNFSFYLIKLFNRIFKI